MLCFINSNCMSSIDLTDNTVVYNLDSVGSNLQNLINLRPLIIPIEMLRMQYKSYMDFVFSDPARFILFFKIVDHLFYSRNVIIIKPNSYVYDDIIEEIQRLMFGRYGYHSNIVNDPEDLYELDDSSKFNKIGVNNYDIDLMHYVQITMPNTANNPYAM